MVIEEDGLLEVNYHDPKDPRKVGGWSDTATHRPIRPSVLVKAGVCTNEADAGGMRLPPLHRTRDLRRTAV